MDKNINIARRIFEALFTEFVIKLISLAIIDDVWQLIILGLGSVVTFFIAFRPISSSTLSKVDFALLIRIIISFIYIAWASYYGFIHIDYLSSENPSWLSWLGGTALIAIAGVMFLFQIPPVPFLHIVSTFILGPGSLVIYFIDGYSITLIWGIIFTPLCLGAFYVWAKEQQ